MEDNDRFRIAEYTAIRSEMQSITTARYTVLALTITGIAAILAVLLNVGLRLPHSAVLAPLAISAILLPSMVVNLTLSRQFHRLSSYNVVFGQPNFRQQEAFEIYSKKRPHHWAYVRPLAFTYVWLLAGTAAVLAVLFWSCQMLIAVLLMVGAHLWPILKLWDTSLTGRAREEDMKLWNEIKKEMSVVADGEKREPEKRPS